jgi:hypothetical protein
MKTPYINSVFPQQTPLCNGSYSGSEGSVFKSRRSHANYLNNPSSGFLVFFFNSANNKTHVMNFMTQVQAFTILQLTFVGLFSRLMFISK